MGDAFQFGLIPPGSGVLCALSGGADSMYLLCRLLEGRERYGWRVCAAHLNHGLRETAGRDEKFVRDWCGRRGVPLAVGLEDVAGYARREGLSLEEAGRTLRYRFLGQAALEAGCPLIATGHHAGDSAETVLMNLIRGCGLKGLAGIPERRDNIVRPMLEVSRGEIEAYLKEHGVPHVEDETNDDVNYTRNKVRHQLLPLLEELNPQAAAHIAAAARRLREDEEELSRQAAPLAAEGLDIPDGVALPVRVLREAPRPLALRACAGLLERAGLGAQAVHLERVLALALGDDPSAGADLPGGRAYRQYELLVLAPGADPEPPAPAQLREGEQAWGEWRIWCTPAPCPAKAYISPWEFYLRPEAYLVRPRREGDRLTLGRRPEKTVKKLMIEGKVPARRRARVPVLALGGRAAAVGGLGPEKDCLAAPGAPALHIIIKIEENVL
ncbi:MAG: tRNA lysidine(34) synthetase TilS [Oscillospiraceae bacterium]|jgi:tRNA(Ile)-lysidine synthase|nr:tRNA lysidine(34) synthetase TilS [Oscillospiraceae bacterium]